MAELRRSRAGCTGVGVWWCAGFLGALAAACGVPDRQLSGAGSGAVERGSGGSTSPSSGGSAAVVVTGRGGTGSGGASVPAGLDAPELAGLGQLCRSGADCASTHCEPTVAAALVCCAAACLGGDACTGDGAACQAPALVLCGNGALDAGEECDQPDGTCTTDCKLCASGFANGNRCELVVGIAAERNSSCALTDAGSLWCWGNNESGKLDGSSTTRFFTPRRIADAGDARDVAIGQSHLCVVRAEGAAYCRGSRAEGALGDGGPTSGTSAGFVQVIGEVNGLNNQPLAGLIGIEAGLRYTCAIAVGASGPVFCWGDAPLGEMGKVVTNAGPHPTAVQVDRQSGGSPEPIRDYSRILGADDYMLATKPGLAAVWGSTDAASEGRLLGGSGFFALELAATTQLFAAGAFNACRVNGSPSSSLELECTGELGVGLLEGEADHFLFPEVTDIADMSVGNGFGCLVRGAARGLACWGINGEGRLGTGSTSPLFQGLQSVAGVSGVARMDSGDFHTCIVTSLGGVSCWGRGNEGQLGNNDSAGSRAPTPVFVR